MSSRIYSFFFYSLRCSLYSLGVPFPFTQVYYELVQSRKEQQKDDIAICRVEQIAPFPFDHVAEQIAKYSNAEVVWAQEEPKNMGMWFYVNPRIATATRYDLSTWACRLTSPELLH